MNAAHNSPTREYMHRLGYYWQSLAVYAVALLLYVLLKGTIVERRLSVQLDDPLALLLLAFIVVSGISMAVNAYIRKSIAVGEDFFALRNRYRQTTVHLRDIRAIRFLRERRNDRGAYRIISISTGLRRRPYRLRPAGFDNEKELIADFLRLKSLVAGNNSGKRQLRRRL